MDFILGVHGPDLGGGLRGSGFVGCELGAVSLAFKRDTFFRGAAPLNLRCRRWDRPRRGRGGFQGRGGASRALLAVWGSASPGGGAARGGAARRAGGLKGVQRPRMGGWLGEQRESAVLGAAPGGGRGVSEGAAAAAAAEAFGGLCGALRRLESRGTAVGCFACAHARGGA